MYILSLSVVEPIIVGINDNSIYRLGTIVILLLSIIYNLHVVSP